MPSKPCPHGRQKHRCKECGGSSICPHNRVKSKCKECGGSQICLHNREKSTCKECGGSQICPHNREKLKCKERGGSSICLHNRVKSRCKECGWSQICLHNREKSTCKECGGSQICLHNRQKSTCKECGWSQICQHNRQKSTCLPCMTDEKVQQNGFICVLCSNVRTRTGLCTDCFVALEDSPKIRIEAVCRASLDDVFEGLRFCEPVQLGRTTCKTNEVKPGTAGKTQLALTKKAQLELTKKEEKAKKTKKDLTRAWPDIYFVGQDSLLIVKIDENRHQFYNVTCETRRYDTLLFGTSFEQILSTKVIRFNPHVLKGKTLSDFEDRLRALISAIEAYLHRPLSEDECEVPFVTVQYMYYGEGESKHWEAAKAAVGTLRVEPDINDLLLEMSEKAKGFNLSSVSLTSCKTQTKALINLALGPVEGLCNQIRSISIRCMATALPGKRVCSNHLRQGLVAANSGL